MKMNYWAIDVFESDWETTQKQLAQDGIISCPPVVARDGSETNYKYESDGIEIVVGRDARVSGVFLIVVPDGEYARYTGTFPDGVSESSNRAEVRRILGEPDRAIEVQNVMVLGPQPASDIYRFGEAAINFRFGGPQGQLSEMSVYSRSRASL